MLKLDVHEKISGYFLTVVFVTTAILFPSLQIYLGNVDQFSSSLASALKLGALLALLCLLILLVFFKYSSLRSRIIVGLILASLSILFWIQANLLVWDYGVLDGSAIDWHAFQSRALIDTAAWVCGIAVLFVLFRFKLGNLVAQLALILWVAQTVSIIFSLVAHGSALGVKGNTYSAGKMQTMANFSTSQNVLHIVVDAFQADVFEQLIANKAHSEYYHTSFEGFVYYRETLGIFPRTKYSVPAFLSGKVYDNSVEHGYIDSVLKGKTILSVAAKNQYSIDIVADGAYQTKQYRNLPHDSILDLNDLPVLGRELSEAALLLDISVFRVLPGFLKPLVYNEQKWTFAQLVRGGRREHLNFEYFTNAIFLNEFIEAMAANTEARAYKYIHLFSTHGAKVVSKECRYAGGVYPHSRETYEFMAKCTMDSLAKLLNKMKKLGIYDDALILIHADHGGWVWNLRRPEDDSDIGFKVPSESTPRLLPITIRSAASPLLIVKAPKATGRIRTSNKLASLLDIPDTVSDIMSWDEQFNHRSLVTLPEGEQRKRYFRYYDREKHSEKNDFTGPMAEYSIEGSHYESPWILETLLLPRSATE